MCYAIVGLSCIAYMQFLASMGTKILQTMTSFEIMKAYYWSFFSLISLFDSVLNTRLHSVNSRAVEEVLAIHLNLTNRFISLFPMASFLNNLQLQEKPIRLPFSEIISQLGHWLNKKHLSLKSYFYLTEKNFCSFDRSSPV